MLLLVSSPSDMSIASELSVIDEESSLFTVLYNARSFKEYICECWLLYGVAVVECQ